jgi:hypothetical protein
MSPGLENRETWGTRRDQLGYFLVARAADPRPDRKTR